jgi:Tfp pilus assembly protein PilW
LNNRKIHINAVDGPATQERRAVEGFSLVELVVAMAISLLILGVGVASFAGALGSRDRESSRTDALTAAQAALNIMSREIGNAGYGIVDGSELPINGIVAADSNAHQVHFRENVENAGTAGTVVTDKGEDLTFYCESCDVNCTAGSVVRRDANGNGVGNPLISGIINRVSDVDFAYSDVNPTTGVVTSGLTTPSTNTIKVSITLKVCLADVRGQPSNRQEMLKSEVALRNSTYMLQQY